MNIEPIDTSTTAGKAEVMRLAAEGRGLAYKNKFNKKWERHVQPEICDWDWRTASFAIIAEPVGPEEVWFTVINGNCDAGPYTYECTAVDRAQNYGGQPVRYVRDDLAGGKA